MVMFESEVCPGDGGVWRVWSVCARMGGGRRDGAWRVGWEVVELVRGLLEDCWVGGKERSDVCGGGSLVLFV